ncbi:MAG: sigma 54-interacting transcriptional regulator [Desulfobacterales bacterium]|nr:MAG: sigma 54-interacting transcriptional regulator [Desulfobacterales bacterium]
MNVANDLFPDQNFTKTLVDAFPCGLLVVDEQGRIRIVNDLLERALKIDRKASIGKATGNVLGCLHASEHPKGCGFSECCEFCEVLKLTFQVLTTKQKQTGRANMQLVINGRLRDLALMLSAFPFTINNKSYCLLAIENHYALKYSNSEDTKEGFRGIIGNSSNMQDLFDTIRQVAPTDAAVLIQGESGTGKELVALATHRESPRANKHFVPVNCGALPEGLLESELFGHIKGAFTGAHRDRKGRFELADGGTVFLDEIGELSSAMQVKLLRVLQDGSFEPVGSERTVKVNIRVISATNKNLDDEVLAGRFRKDLYYRLCVMPITVIPLRERREDIPFLIDHFLNRYAEESPAKKIRLSPSALSILMKHSWPGNVRELQNVIQFALVKSRGTVIKPEHLPPVLQAYMANTRLPRHHEPSLKEAEVFKALVKTNGNRLRAAELLGVSRSTLYRFFSDHCKNSIDSCP